ncbi:MAG: hypothetical protein CL840_06610 [Crocinitomicaceae bacterium]|nr:hypothetical protein [Crocinitomicaceae bacterium]|tara:strand:- start:11671 stop:12264 length:594 start_codon:yes stop_codon:yes gene_type:complete
MKSIRFRLIGHDHLLLDLCRSHLSRHSFVDCKPILDPSIFLKLQVCHKAEIILLDLPIDKQKFYELAIKVKQIFPNSIKIAIAHHNNINEVYGYQHLDKLFDEVLERRSATEDLDRIVAKLKKRFNIKLKSGQVLNFTSKEKEVIRLTCKEYKNEDIARSLRISIRTVETHKSNIYGKLGVRNPARLFNYAKEFGLI